MSASSHEEQVNRQFGQSASAYLTSAAHAQGADLKMLPQLLQGQGDAQVLDIGCGAGHASFAVAPRVAQVIAYDLSPQILELVAREAARRGLHNLSVKQRVAEALPFPDASFDHVLTRFSAHHWSDLAAALKEVRRVLKPGGRFIAIDVMAPAKPLFDTHLQCIELLRDVSHVRNYSHTQWDQHLRAAGFAIDSHSEWKLPLEFQAWVARMQTPPERIAVIQGLLHHAPQEVRDYLQVQADCSFSLDVVMFEASLLQS